MILLLFLILICSLLISGVRFNSKLGTKGEYITRDRTTMINGFFIWLVFLCHIQEYNFVLPTADSILHRCTIGAINQCIVATFFFYSGYGIMLALKRNGVQYASCLIRQRFTLLLVHFSIAVLIFAAVQYIIGVTFPIRQIVLSLVGWCSIGNSNWFIFVTLISYLFIAISYVSFRKIGNLAVIGFVVIVLSALISLLSYRGGHWVSTPLCLPAGMLFCIAREKFENMLKHIFLPIWLSGLLIMVLGAFVFNFSYSYLGFYGKNAGAIMFAFGITFAFSGIIVKRPPSFLCWCGGPGLFFLYIFQRIPMLIGVHLEWHTTSTIFYEAFCILTTLAIAWFSYKVFPYIDQFLNSFLAKRKEETKL